MARNKDRRAKRKPGKTARSMPEALWAGLEQVVRLVRRKQWNEALQHLEALDQRFPDRPLVLRELVNICYELKDDLRSLRYCERLSRLEPHDADVALELAGAYLNQEYFVLALQAFRRFLARHPEHPRASKAREVIFNLEPLVQDIMTGAQLAGEEGLELAALADTIRLRLAQGRYREARAAAERLLERRPDFISALNNLSQIDFLEGHREQAIATARRVLDLDPDNLQAHSNLARYLYLSGRVEQALRQAARLKGIEPQATEGWVKKAEALAYLGDDEGVLSVFRQAQAAGQPESAMFHHWAAVAALRQGDEREARKRWRRALELDPNLDLARDNLADLDRPVHERHTPWPFSLHYWIPQHILADVARRLAPSARRDDSEVATRVARTCLKQHPELGVLIPALLERGDPDGRRFALHLASMAGTPELLTAVRDFALSRHGPDGIRLEASQIAHQAGLLPSGSVRMWLKGEWKNILLMNIQVHGEPSIQHESQVEPLLAQAMEALRGQDPGKAEALLEQALEIEPDAPDILNNLATAYERQGRRAEAIELLRRIHRDHPDYLFGCITMAVLHLREGDTGQAEALLAPLLGRGRLHFSELAALCEAYIRLQLTKGDLDSARSWLDMWARADPDHPNLRLWRSRLDGGRKR